MLRAITWSRNLHATSLNQRTHLMTKLGKFQKDHILLNKTDKEYRKHQEYKQIKLKKHVKTPYNKQKVTQILHERYNIPMESLNDVDIGPTSTQDIDIFRSINNNKTILLRDKRLLFTMLGVSGEQMRDSKLISDDVEKFLKRDQPEKALLLIKLANSKKSVVAMNKLIEYYLLIKNDPSTAISLFNWRKKWGIDPNEESFTILFNGISKLPVQISKKNTESLISIIIGLIENKNLGFEMNDIHFNSAMSALINSKDGNAIFELYDIRPKHIKMTSITYTLLLRGFNNYYSNIMQKDSKLGSNKEEKVGAAETDKSFDKFYEFFRTIVDRIPLKYMDDKLCYEMIYSLSRRGLLESEDRLLRYKILSDCCNGIVHYFDFKDLMTEKHALEMIPNSEDLFSKSDITLKKFKLNDYVIVLMLELMGENGSFKKMDELFHKMLSDEKLNNKITSYVLETYFVNVLKGYGEICDEKMLKVLQKVDKIGTRRVISKEIQYLMNTSFLTKLQNANVLRDHDKVALTFQNFFNYYKEFGLINSAESSKAATPSKKWYIYFEMIRRSRFLDKFGHNRHFLQKYFLDEYLSGIKNSEFLISTLSKSDNISEINFKKDIDIKAINMLNHFIYNLYSADARLNGEQMNYRKALMQLKDFLLKRCTLMDIHMKKHKNTPDEEDATIPATRSESGDMTFEQLNESIKPALATLQRESMP